MDGNDKLCYYQVLEINRNADLDQVRKAYRKQSLKWHPDKNIDNKEEAEQKFKVISEAYQVLTDLEKRKRYDLYGFDEENEQTQDYMPEFTFRSSNDIFREFFGNDPFMSSFFPMSQHQSGFGFMPFPNFSRFHGFGHSAPNMFHGSFSTDMFNRQPLFNDSFFANPFDDRYYGTGIHHAPTFNPHQTFFNGFRNFTSFPGFMGNQLHTFPNGVSFSSTMPFIDVNDTTHIRQQSFSPSTQSNSTAHRVDNIRSNNNSQQMYRPGNGERHNQVGQNTNPKNYRPY